MNDDKYPELIKLDTGIESISTEDISEVMQISEVNTLPRNNDSGLEERFGAWVKIIDN